MKKAFLVIALMLASATAFCQFIARPVNRPKANPVSTEEPKKSVVYARIEGNDTILIVHLPEVDIDLMSRYFQITETRQGRRLVSNVRKVYPYAKLASDKLQEYDTILANADSDAERRRLMRQAEDELSEQYTEELTHLTFTQGAILIRLIDRETGNTSYKLVQELRGKVRAFFYQGFARLWGYNLKAEFDPRTNKSMSSPPYWKEDKSDGLTSLSLG